MPFPSGLPAEKSPQYTPPEPDVVDAQRLSTEELQEMQGSVSTGFIIDYQHEQNQQPAQEQDQQHQAVVAAAAQSTAKFREAGDEVVKGAEQREKTKRDLEQGGPKTEITDVIDPDTHERISSQPEQASKKRSRKRTKDRSR